MSPTRPHHADVPSPWSAGPVTLHTGDASGVLAAMPEQSVDCVVTSPPYWGLRDYGTGHWDGGQPDCPHTEAPSLTAAHRAHQPRTCPKCTAIWADQQHGLEPDLDDYLRRMVTVFGQIRRVLRPDGTAWVNLGDSYASGEAGRNDSARRYPSLVNGQPARTERRTWQRSGIPGKNLLGVPWRVALALQADGWWLRNAIVWAKTNPMPESVTDRLSGTYEMLFLLTRSARYHFDLDALRVPPQHPDRHLPDDRWQDGQAEDGQGHDGQPPLSGTGLRHWARPARRRKYLDTDPATLGFRRHGPAIAGDRAQRRVHPNGKNPGDVWRLPTRRLPEAHFAAFPIDLPLRCIAAGSRPGGLVLDPFSGAGTTGLAALRLARRYLGVELNPDYTAIARRRLLPHLDADNPSEASS